MLSKPEYGWTEVRIGSILLGSASYLTDVPFDTLNAFIQYFTEYNSMNFSIHYDAEGYYFGILEFDASLYFVHEANAELECKEISPKEVNLAKCSTAKDILKTLAYELIDDIENHIRDWANWELDEDIIKFHSTELLLKEKCDVLRDLINKT